MGTYLEREQDMMAESLSQIISLPEYLSAGHRTGLNLKPVVIDLTGPSRKQ